MENGAPESESAEALAAYLDTADSVARLTARERKVGGLIAGGYTFRKVAELHGISVKTIDDRLAGIFAKMALGDEGKGQPRKPYRMDDGALESEAAKVFAAWLPAAQAAERLSATERRICSLITQGYTFRKTAERLHMSVKAVDNHMTDVFAKIDSGDLGPREDGTAGIREPRNPHPPIDSAGQTAEPDHRTPGPSST
jgi:DNA-binding CsgD family transcriptional regulator